MLDIKFIRENKDIVAAGAKKKHIEIDLDRLLELDDKRKTLQQSYDEKRNEQNKASDLIAAAQLEERKKMVEGMQGLKEEMKAIEAELEVVMQEWRNLMVRVPNVPDMTVPEGTSDADNKEVKTWPARSDGRGGEKTEFDFEPKSASELLLAHGMADFERGAKVAGFRGYFLKGDGVRLVWALERFVQDRFMNREGFEPIIVPSLVRKEPFIGTGYLPQSEEDLYKTQDGEYLAGTAEVAGMGYYMNETIDKKDLPIKFFAFSPCFRREAGSHGKDEKGIFRVHEFVKYEQIVMCEASHEESVKHHEELTANSEALLQELKLPYHVVLNCGGDIGLGQVKKYDIEAWMPSEKKYRETHSSSYFHDFQTRRLNIRYRDDDGQLKFVHSLNNTALALPRILCHIVENFQQKDGSIVVPEVLRAYMGKDAITAKKSS
ncbi:MAG: serine--tRNA ligase [Minisyncoccia bacterium]